MVSHGQYFTHNLHPIQTSRSISTSFLWTSYSGPATTYMQSTGHTSKQTSQPVQPDWSMTASSFGRFLRAGAAAAGFGAAGGTACGVSDINSHSIVCIYYNKQNF